MKKSQFDKYGDVWAILITLIQKHDKSYALGLYSLLAETIEDSAYAYQLEADILWHFKDHRAILQYECAAQEYQEHGNISAAIGLYNQLIKIDNNPAYIAKRATLIANTPTKSD